MNDEKLLIAFVQGAKWWEFQKTGATMWQSDQNEALERAKALLEGGFLGLTLEESIKKSLSVKGEGSE